ncbi:hypothetical protein OIV83_006215 [Microbotryomycetes sp. JL201]|nr:hypothetical protein OIV83_006215 [Microbotryomycetes sp. JL201]
MPHTGSCLCGQSTVKVSSDHDAQIACHCTDCQRTSGSAFSTNFLVKFDDAKFDGPIKEYQSAAASGATVTRGFCGNCGCALYHKMSSFGDSFALQTGWLDGSDKLKFASELFVKDRWSGLGSIPGADQVQKMPE